METKSMKIKKRLVRIIIQEKKIEQIPILEIVQDENKDKMTD